MVVPSLRGRNGGGRSQLTCGGLWESAGALCTARDSSQAGLGLPPSTAGPPVGATGSNYFWITWPGVGQD